MQIWTILCATAGSLSLSLTLSLAHSIPISIPPPVLDGLSYLRLDRALEDKYFHEPVGHENGADDRLGHYDTRYFHEMVSDEERVETLHHMVRAYLDFFRENQLETWISHGTLLGWWWNGKLLPWDWDVDTQVRDATLTRMAREFNRTISQYVSPDRKYKREYMLDINPWAYFRDQGPGHNIIDARWIDTTNGLYIDITALSRFDPVGKPDTWECKNWHKYETEDLFPLRESTFEGVTAMVPYKYQEMLLEEYTVKSLTRTKYHNHTWYPEQGQWIFSP
ncbi:putative mannosylphosphate transferase [Talaromyces proteolyticus]|uniref:Mannosylphosphate transferase n=1 Tax=Talaromyces proteolyticus TaxID=1131652 RepID=A0AAD4PYX3_9EURO|nr:putative mannosylphosphate transferase [Talaromyces proteolyticus]KAH8698396.1 putative mannosylphosphate transferase [Talaromyces proteolyticus]